MNKEKCRSCGAEIIWAETTEGKRIPLNKTRVRGYLPVQRDGGRSPLAEEMGLACISHFITCPQAYRERNRIIRKTKRGDWLEAEKRHRFQIFYDREEDGRWIAGIHDLPGCLVYGETQAEAFRAVIRLAAMVLRRRRA